MTAGARVVVAPLVRVVAIIPDREEVDRGTNFVVDVSDRPGDHGLAPEVGYVCSRARSTIRFSNIAASVAFLAGVNALELRTSFNCFDSAAIALWSSDRRPAVPFSEAVATLKISARWSLKYCAAPATSPLCRSVRHAECSASAWS